MKKRSISVILLFILTVCTTIYAQKGVIVHAGVTFPEGDFGNTDVNSSSSSGAATGFNVGIELRHKLTNDGLNAFASIDYLYNGLSKQAKDDFNNSLGASYKIDIDYLHFKNIPILAGFNFSNRIVGNYSILLNVGLGVDFLSISDMRVAFTGQSITTSTTAKPALAYKVGGGVMIGNRYIIEANYLGLGDHDTSITKRNGTKIETSEGSLDISTLNLTFGIQF